MLICKKPRIFDVDIFGPAVILALIAVAYFAAIKPINRMAAEHQDQRKALIVKQTSDRQELIRRQELDKQQKALAGRLSKTTDILQKNQGISHAIRQLGSLAKANSLQLNEFSPDQTTTEQYFSITPLKLRLAGSFPQLRTFLDSLAEKMPYVRVTSLTLNKKAASELSICNIDLALDLFGQN